MRIGLIASPWIPVPPPSYGGTELIVDNLARGLAARGHDVRLFTVPQSTCPVEKLSVLPAAAEPMGFILPETQHVIAAYEAFDDVDVIHDHTVLGPVVAAGHKHPDIPVVFTNHGQVSPTSRCSAPPRTSARSSRSRTTSTRATTSRSPRSSTTGSTSTASRSAPAAAGTRCSSAG